MGKAQFYPAKFDIDISVCMSCQICVEVCPFEAIKMDTEFELSTDEMCIRDSISDGSANPYRYRVRPPSLINLTVLEDMCVGRNIADVVIILGSVDIVLGEVDR